MSDKAEKAADAESRHAERVAEALKGRYDIERMIGRGGMAFVFLATDRKLGRPVAVKVLDPAVSSKLGAARFVREVQITAPLQHPNILPLIDSGTVDDIVYSVMPFVEGETIRDRLLREGALPLEDALLYARELAEALDYAHKRGIVHRDVKPENVLLSNGAAVITDFGIARASTVSDTGTLTHSGLPVGTPAYMSPEQVTGREAIDGRADIYSLGCMLHEMLTGRPPFAGAEVHDVLRAHLETDPPDLAALRPEAGDRVIALVRKAMAKRPGDRFQSAGDLAAELRLLLGEPQRQPTPPDAVAEAPTADFRRRPPRFARPRGAGGWLVAAALVAGALALAVLLRRAMAGEPPDAGPPAAVVPADSAPVAPPPVAPTRASPAPAADSLARAAVGATAPRDPLLEALDLERPVARVRLPSALAEVSGLAMLPDGRLLAHGDEQGQLYSVDPATGDARAAFAVPGLEAVGDWEEVVVAGSRVFLVRSDGRMAEWRLDAPTPSPTWHPSALGSPCEVEGAAAVPERDALLLLCKQHGHAEARGDVIGWWWSLATGTRPDGPPFRVRAADLGGKGKFSPSGAVRDPGTGHLLVVAGPERRLAEVDLAGRVIATRALARASHPQPEGIALGADGRLFIADEDRRKGGSLTTYAPAPSPPRR
jgi:hypothetical protein